MGLWLLVILLILLLLGIAAFALRTYRTLQRVQHEKEVALEAVTEAVRAASDAVNVDAEEVLALLKRGQVPTIESLRRQGGRSPKL